MVCCVRVHGGKDYHRKGQWGYPIFKRQLWWGLQLIFLVHVISIQYIFFHLKQGYQ